MRCYRATRNPAPQGLPRSLDVIGASLRPASPTEWGFLPGSAFGACALMNLLNVLWPEAWGHVCWAVRGCGGQLMLWVEPSNP